MNYQWLWHIIFLSMYGIQVFAADLATPSTYSRIDDIFSFVHSASAEHKEYDDTHESMYHKMVTGIIQSETFTHALSTLCAANRTVEKKIDIAAGGQKIKGVAAAVWCETLRQAGFLHNYLSSSPKESVKRKEQETAVRFCGELYAVITQETEDTQTPESLGALIGIVDSIVCDTFTCNTKLDTFLSIFIQRVIYPLAEKSIEKLPPPSAEEQEKAASHYLAYLCLVLATFKLRINVHEKRHCLPHASRLLERDIMRLSIEKQEPLSVKELTLLVHNLCE